MNDTEHDAFGLTVAAHTAVEALFIQIQDIAHEGVRDAYPGHFGPTHTARYDTAADRTAALERITASLARIAPATPARAAAESKFTDALAWAVNEYHRHAAAALTATLGTLHRWGPEPGGRSPAAARVLATSGTGRAAAYIGTLVTFPGAHPILSALDDVEGALTSGAGAERLAKTINALIGAFGGHVGDAFGTYLADAHHYALLTGAPDIDAPDRTRELQGITDELDTTRAILARDYLAHVRHTGPVALVIMNAETTEHERNMRGYTNAYTRYKLLDSPNAADFADIDAARAAAITILEQRGAAPEDISAARVLGYGSTMIATGLHILIREPIGK